MASYKGIAYMRRRLDLKRERVLLRYKYYEMKQLTKMLNMSDIKEMHWLNHTLGWCSKAVDSLADRLVFNGFEQDNFDLTEIFQMNNPDTLYDSAILSACISSCCFIYISPDKDNYPRLQVIDGANATGMIDPITGLLTEGYAVLNRDDNGNAIVEAYFLPGTIQIIRKGYDKPQLNKNNVPYPLLVPIIHRPDARREFGRSRISRSCMKLTDAAVRTITRSEISAEFYSYPQRFVLGTSQDAQPIDKWKAVMTSLIEITRDDEGNVPTVGQFQQQSMTPHLEQLRSLASAFAGETGLTLDDLGFPSDNPSSAEAIKASHETLRLAARKAQRTFGSGFLNVGYLAACLRDNFAYERKQLYLTKPTWAPIFEPDAAMLSSMGDGAIKINQAVPGYFNKDNLEKMTGIPASEEPAQIMQEVGV